ncbi:TMEM165/GDT1 family protein [Oculatella sp. LEGE 06141]|nr:TMEM165/GDT1 family protein [Oculatella sp. LEGE 06141]
MQPHFEPPLVPNSLDSVNDDVAQDSTLPVAGSSEERSHRPPANEVKIFLSTFLTIFLAELGDKTQVATLLMSAESQSPWVVFAGASLALVATSLLGVSLGCWLAKRVSKATLETATGAILLLVSVLLLWDVVGM